MSQLALTLTGPEPIHAPPAAEPGTYPCPCCGGRVVDEYTEGDALCCWSVAAFLRAVEGAAMERCAAEAFPDGAEVDIDCCDYCGTWTAGERRCSCGSRRSMAEVEGNVVDGLFAYARAY